MATAGSTHNLLPGSERSDYNNLVVKTKQLSLKYANKQFNYSNPNIQIFPPTGQDYWWKMSELFRDERVKLRRSQIKYGQLQIEMSTFL